MAVTEVPAGTPEETLVRFVQLIDLDRRGPLSRISTPCGSSQWERVSGAELWNPTSRQKRARYGAPRFAAGQDFEGSFCDGSWVGKGLDNIIVIMVAPSAFPILQQSPREAHAHEAFSASRQLEETLRQKVRGEVRFDEASRALYATDASNYRQVPIGLVVPLDEADVIATIAACRAAGAPVLSRGGGDVARGPVLQCGRDPRLLEIYARDRGARCGAEVCPGAAGIVLDRLRDAAEEYDLTFAPDPATHSRCTLGDDRQQFLWRTCVDGGQDGRQH